VAVLLLLSSRKLQGNCLFNLLTLFLIGIHFACSIVTLRISREEVTEQVVHKYQILKLRKILKLVKNFWERTASALERSAHKTQE
jgi:hypothetical protein